MKSCNRSRGISAGYKVRDGELGRLAALKTIRGDLAQNPDVLHRFKHELILARKVTHPNVTAYSIWATLTA